PAGEAGPPAPAPLPEAVQAGAAPAPPARLSEPALASATLPALVRSLAAQMPPTGLVPGAGPLRILTLQLNPADLGAVTVRMRLRDGDLEMNLGASRAETAELLRKDAGVLADLLRGSGYRPEILTIQAEPRLEAGARAAPAFADAPPQGGSGADHPARRGPQDHAGERTPSSRDTSDDPAPSLAPRGSGVYL
ncbi:MAG: flagellar hook-length control protein FliK, partial [Methylobacterium sp.]|uniref:flagellar hook-length control protein FliK n=1 Tax=Methylobacterium sp. TaxID=409 RepID=UPI00258809A6